MNCRKSDQLKRLLESLKDGISKIFVPSELVERLVRSIMARIFSTSP